MSETPSFLGPYRIIRRLGAGGMGEVFLAHDDRLDRQVALKLLHAEARREPEVRERFRREARLAAQLNHPAIVHIYDVAREGEYDAIVMEYVPGTTLRSRLELGTSTLGQRLRWASQIAAGMAVAHNAGIIHRDLKSENILIGKTDEAKITDFGIARKQDSERLTADSAIVGTLRAMSPEQATGQPLDYRTDLFSFGVLLYEAFGHVSPFLTEAPYTTLARVVHEPHRPLGELVPELPAELIALVDRLLAKPPSLRPRDFHEVGRALQPLVAANEEETGRTAPPFRPGAEHLAVNALGETITPLLPAELGSTPTWPRAEASESANDAVAATLASGPAPAADLASAGRAAPQPLGRAAGDRAGAPDAAPAEVGPAPSAEPRRTSRRWGTLSLGLVGVGLLGLGLSISSRPHAPVQPGPAPAPLLYVAVLAPEFEPHNDPDLALRASSLRLLIENGLTGLEGIAVSALAEVDHLQTPTSSPKALATALDAGELVTSRIACPGAVCSITLTRIRGQDGALLWTDMVQLGRDLAFYGQLDVVTAKLRQAYRDHRVQPGANVFEVSAQDFEHFVRLQRDAQTRDPRLTPERLHAELAGIRERSPGFLPAYFFEIDTTRTRYHQSKTPADLERARQLLALARRIAPERAEVGVSAFEVAVAGGNLDQAAAELTALERLGVDPVVLWQLRADLLARRGEAAEPIALLRKAAAAHPSWRVLLQLANAELHSGDLGAARQHYRQLIARAPDNYDGLQALAQLELIGGDASRAAELYTRLAARAPDFFTLGNLGIALLLAGRTSEARAPLERARTLEPRNPAALFNLADAELIAGEHERARAHYREVLALLAGAPASDWPSRLARAQALGHVGEAVQALAELQAALHAAPGDNGDVAYAAAVVHALAGDLASSLVHIENALRLGYAPHWFAFPWFDAVRQDARYAALLHRPESPGRAAPAH
ncbi:MAG TPA: protein kinase [Polyangia bacterium]|jgi:serine/threonine-protein kinase|nr:protein kinase [Polyangia bacterium]